MGQSQKWSVAKCIDIVNSEFTIYFEDALCLEWCSVEAVIHEMPMVYSPILWRMKCVLNDVEVVYSLSSILFSSLVWEIKCMVWKIIHFHRLLVRLSLCLKFSDCCKFVSCSASLQQTLNAPQYSIFFSPQQCNHSLKTNDKNNKDSIFHHCSIEQ